MTTLVRISKVKIIGFIFPTEFARFWTRTMDMWKLRPGQGQEEKFSKYQDPRLGPMHALLVAINSACDVGPRNFIL